MVVSPNIHFKLVVLGSSSIFVKVIILFSTSTTSLNDHLFWLLVVFSKYLKKIHSKSIIVMINNQKHIQYWFPLPKVFFFVCSRCLFVCFVKRRRKEFELLRHLAANAFPWAAVDVLGSPAGHVESAGRVIKNQHRRTLTAIDGTESSNRHHFTNLQPTGIGAEMLDT